MSSVSSEEDYFVPPSALEKIGLLQECFDSACNEDGIVQLYEPEFIHRMWQSVRMRQKREVIVEETPSPDITKSALKDESANTESPTKVAAVLVLLVMVNGEDLSVVLTRRSKHLTHHASEISFAGGHFDEELDDTLLDTAVREAVEELYPPAASPDDAEQRMEAFRSHLYIVGCTSEVPSLRGTPVTPVLAMYAATKDDPTELTTAYLARMWPGNRDEVDVVFTVPLETLIKQHDFVMDLSYEPGDDRPSLKKLLHKAPPQYSTSFGRIWGLTAYILQPILDKLLIPLSRNTPKPAVAQLLYYRHEKEEKMPIGPIIYEKEKLPCSKP